MPLPNPPTPIASLLAPMTAPVVLQTMIDALVVLGIRADLWPVEGVMISGLTVVSRVISGGINDRIRATQAGWLPTATGGWLEWLALYMYGVVKAKATFASGSLTLTNNGGGVFSFAPFTATFQNPTTGKNYTNTAAIALAAGPGTSQTVAVQATELGTKSNSIAGAITKIVTTMINVTCANLSPVLGIDDQSDASLQLACWNAIAANSAYGPRQSFGYAVQTAVNSVTGSPVNINRWLVSPSSHTGKLTLTLASPSGVADVNDVAGVQTRIDAAARPECVTATAVSAALLPITDQFTVWVSATPGLNAATVRAAMATALQAFFANYPIGGLKGAGGLRGLFASAIEGVLYAAWPGVFDVQGPVLGSPNLGQPVDHPMTSSQVAVYALPPIVVVLQ